MTLNEFKAWLDGFSSAIDGAPTEKQWEIIMQKLATVTPDVVRETIRVKDFPPACLPMRPMWVDDWCGGGNLPTLRVTT